MNYGKRAVWTCDHPPSFCHLHVNLTAPTTEIDILVNKPTPHFIEQQSERKPTRNHTNLHSLICVDSATLQKVDVKGLIYGPEGGRVLLQERIRDSEKKQKRFSLS